MFGNSFHNIISNSMKTNIYIAAAMLAVAATIFAGCNREEKIQIAKSSIALSDSLCSIETEKSVFSAKTKRLDYSLNELNNRIDSIYDSRSGQLQETAAEDSHFMENGMGYELIMKDSVFMATEKLISLRILTYIYTGGAHGNTMFSAINYAPQSLQFLTTDNIFDANATAEIDSLLLKHFNNEDGCFWEKPTVAKASAVNIGNSEVTFIYNQYELGAYSCGPATVNIPIEEIGQYMIVQPF